MGRHWMNLLIHLPGGWPILTGLLSLITPPTTPAVAAAATRAGGAGDRLLMLFWSRTEGLALSAQCAAARPEPNTELLP